MIIDDYIRGLYDGDGSLWFTKNNYPYISIVTKSDDIANFLISYISNITNKPLKTLNKNKRYNIYNITIHKEDAILLCEKLYYNDCLSINRKYNITKNIMSCVRPENMKNIDFERKEWTKHEDEFILTNDIEDSIQELNRTEKSIKIRLCRLKN